MSVGMDQESELGGGEAQDGFEFAGQFLGVGEAEGVGDFRDAFLSIQALAGLDDPDVDQPILDADAQCGPALAAQGAGGACETIRQKIHPEARLAGMVCQAAKILPHRTPSPRPGDLRRD